MVDAFIASVRYVVYGCPAFIPSVSNVQAISDQKNCDTFADAIIPQCPQPVALNLDKIVKHLLLIEDRGHGECYLFVHDVVVLPQVTGSR